ncbi:MAG TPA: diguanylate cyclase [Actinomycetota bacterium]|jgi:diguanylate cyclase (GGDEF)-like protein|nr:diguanylate cyclase [Actinomycetota bacterium]
MSAGSLRVVLVGLVEPEVEEELGREGFTVSRARSVADLALDESEFDAVVLMLPAERPLETYSVARSGAPDAPIVVLTASGHEVDGIAAVRAGAEDHVPAVALVPGLLPRAVRYAVDQHRMRRELRSLEITDPLTGLPNLRGLIPVAEHLFRMADRTRQPVVLVFVQLDDLDAIRTELGPAEADDILVDAAQVIVEGVRDADFPARATDDTFCVLLTGDAEGAEATVLSRLVESIALGNARGDRARPLSLSIGSALYDPASPMSMEGIIETARRRMADQRATRQPDRSEAT